MKTGGPRVSKKPEILIAEDSPTQAEQLKQLLVENNYHVTHAINGRQALVILEKLIPDLIISDILMPEMDGYELCKRIKEDENLKDIPVILLTSLTDPEDVLKGLTCGADNFFTKPYQEDYLISHIQQIIAHHKQYENEHLRIVVEIFFAGKKRIITTDQMQMLTLLLSTYEAAVLQNKQLLKTQEELKSLNESLEEKVEKRTMELKESDKLKSAFLANMSHEIRTPLNGILGFSQLLKERGLTDKEKEDYIDTVDQCTHQLLHTVTDIIDISKIEAGQDMAHPVVFNLPDFLEKVRIFFHPLAGQRNLILTLNNELPGNLVNVLSDPDKFRQALNNIIGNAIKFTETGGVEINISKSNNNLIFKIIDSGIGIEPAFHKVIFDRFRQVEISASRKYGGTGLGLSLAKSFIEMLEGTIEVDSSPGKGSTFTISIPFIPADVPLKEKKKEKMEGTSDVEMSGKTILVAEDEGTNSSVIKSMLKSTGVKILFAVNGIEAVEMCKKDLAISLVLMDIKMPGMDGLSATRLIKSFRSDLPVIATTAYAFSNDKVKCLEAGCNDFLSKPIRKEELINMISKYLI